LAPGPAQLAPLAESAAVVAEAEPVREPPPGVHMPGPSPWPFFAPIALAVIFFGLIFSPFLIIGGVVLGVISAAGWLRDANREWRSTDEFGHAVPATRDPVRAWPRRLVPVFGAIIALSLVLALLPAFGGWLGTLRPAEATPTALAVPPKPEISASSATSFDTKTLIVPAGRPFELVFHNRDEGVPHNVKITDNSSQTTTLFDGEVINGIEDITYSVPDIETGDYYFLCKVHPNMNGTVQARQETGQGGGPPGPPVPGEPGGSGAPSAAP
jgi:plastocyanin